MERTASVTARRRVVTFAVALAVVASTAGIQQARAEGPGNGNPAIVALGDSYISGEAGRWAGNTNGESVRVDALGFEAYREYTPYLNPIYYNYEFISGCHRSRVAEVHTGEVYSLNLACSGATTLTRSVLGKFKPGVDFYGSDGSGGQAGLLKGYARTHNVKMVALSIGGNDFSFASIIRTCIADFYFSTASAPRYCRDDPNATMYLSSSNIARVKSAIVGAIQNVRRAMTDAGYWSSMYTILVQDYPSPIPYGSAFRYSESGYTRQRTGGCGFWNTDAAWANDEIIPTVNGTVDDAVNYVTSFLGATNIKRLYLGSAFNGRRLCEDTVGLLEERGLASWRAGGAVDRTEWVSQARTVSTILGGGSSVYELQEDLHPNYWGQLALRNCLRQAYNSGTPRGGTCTRTGTGFSTRGEPVMTLR
jgi:hypothetical protein